jgi:hypothetical protein
MTKTAICFLPWLALLAACGSDKGGGGGSGAAGLGGSAGGAGTASLGGHPGEGGSPAGGAAGADGSAGMTGADGTAGSAGAGAGGGGGALGADGSAGGTGTGGSRADGGDASNTNTCPTLPTFPTPPAGATDVVNGGTMIQLNDNGAWSWYQDERALVDVMGNKLIVGSNGNAMGPGGAARDGQVEVVVYDLSSRLSQRFQLFRLNPDDHNAPALLVRPDGGYVAMYAGHNQDCLSYFRTFNGTQWGTQGTFDWAPLGCDTAASTKVTYSNLWYMSSESRVYNFVRSVGTSPNLMVSDDLGATWTYGGRLTSTQQVGYVAGYYKYWGNGVDRIDFIGTEAHPRDFDNSLYHGYVKTQKSYNSAGLVIDANITDGTAPDITQFTNVFATGTMMKGVTLTHAWNIDVQRYDDGTISVLFKARADANATDPDHRFLYARFDGTTWRTTYLGKAGHKLYDAEQDYVGLGALHPDDPNTLYISTPIDPRDDTTVLAKHEIFVGVTCDNGATFRWAPITQNSTVDNLRPIIPKWKAKNTALLWWRGTYSTAQIYNAAIVGMLTASP